MSDSSTALVPASRDDRALARVEVERDVRLVGERIPQLPALFLATAVGMVSSMILSFIMKPSLLTVTVLLLVVVVPSALVGRAKRRLQRILDSRAKLSPEATVAALRELLRDRCSCTRCIARSRCCSRAIARRPRCDRLVARQRLTASDHELDPVALGAALLRLSALLGFDDATRRLEHLPSPPRPRVPRSGHGDAPRAMAMARAIVAARRSAWADATDHVKQALSQPQVGLDEIDRVLYGWVHARLVSLGYDLDRVALGLPRTRSAEEARLALRLERILGS